MNNSPSVIPITCFLNGCRAVSDPVVTSLPKGRLHATNITDQLEESIAVRGSYKFTFNLALLRTAGLVFNRFSTGATVSRSADCRSRSFPFALTFRVKFNNLAVWAHTFKTVHKLRPILEVASSVQTLSLIIRRRYPVNRNPDEDCFVAEWLEPTLTQRAPLLPPCYRYCLPSRSLQLHCFFPVCPGVCAETGTNNTFIHVEGRSQVCPRCNVTGCPTDQHVARSIDAVTNSTVTFHLHNLRLHGYDFTVFRTNLVVDHRDTKLCSSPVGFRVLLDDKEVQYHTVEKAGQNQLGPETGKSRSATQVPSTEREMIVVVSGADRLTLQVTTTLKPGCNLTVKWYNPRLLKSLPSPKFTSCNKTCADELDKGRLYLSCFLGVCDGMIARSSNFPFLKIDYYHGSTFGQGIGIGSNRPGSWIHGRGPIQLTYHNGHINVFPFGIGAYPDSSITFRLDAFRSHGYKFNFFVSTLGINSGSGCSSNQLASVIFRVYADDVRVIHMPIHNLRKTRTILYDVSNTAKLSLVTKMGIPNACYHAVWAGAELTTVRFPKSNIQGIDE